jgi:hypothetical protein
MFLPGPDASDRDDWRETLDERDIGSEKSLQLPQYESENIQQV